MARFIDTHMHLGRVWCGAEPFSADEMLRWMDDHDIERSVVLPLESPEASSYPLTTTDALAAAAGHPDRFIAFCVFDPRVAVPDRERDFPAIVREYVDQGAAGFGEVKCGLPLDDPRLQLQFAACNELGLPVLLHLDGERCLDDVRLSRLEATLARFPQATFIGHAPGFWGAVSGDFRDDERTGYPKRPVAPGGAVPRLLEAYPNLMADLSAGSGANAISRDREHGRAFLERYADRLLFATDLLMQGQEVPQFELLASLDLPAEVLDPISRGNAERLLNLA